MKTRITVVEFYNGSKTYFPEYEYVFHQSNGSGSEWHTIPTTTPCLSEEEAKIAIDIFLGHQTKKTSFIVYP